MLDDISLQVQAGEFVVFLGPSGCGKTTLMRMVGGLETPTRGQIFLAGDRITQPSCRQGMVFQSYSSFPWLTVFENVLFGMRYRRDLSITAKRGRARFYLSLMGLEDFSDYYITQISGGMQQRVALARTLAADPDILLMDEPFGALDAQTREFLQYQLLNICQTEKKTVIFVTHDVEEAVFLGDRILVFSARPARVIQDIQVGEFLLGKRTLAIKESDAFLQLRNHILDIVRAQAQQAEQPTRTSAPPKRSSH
ncbi:MAG: ABC transporter ATP-binding protein [Synechococcales bacterium]|nr:ABC transporter ATP-binding protein [Synechococcales bacterium]